jgi:hypothetical protein
MDILKSIASSNVTAVILSATTITVLILYNEILRVSVTLLP